MNDWESQLDKELRFHLDQAIRDYVASGMSEEQARAAARRDFGAVDLAKEECRDTLAVRWLRDLGQDLRYAFRSHRKTPGVAIVAVLTLALGIGSATSIFSLVHAVLLRSLPYADARNLAYVWSPNSNFSSAPWELAPSNKTYYDWQRLSHSFQDLAMFGEAPMQFAGPGNSRERLDAVQVTGNFFRTLGVEPELGRTIGPEDDQPGHNGVAVISHNLWQRGMGGVRDVLGRTVQLDRKSYRVIGVMPAAFHYPMRWEMPQGVRPPSLSSEVWVPLGLKPAERADEGFAGLGDGNVIGRLRRGVSVSQAQAEMTVIMRQLVAKREGMAKGSSALVNTLLATAFGDVDQEMMLLLGAVALVLLLTCTNVANLLLARYSGRMQEMAVRSALGASRSRLVRLIVTEGLLLTFAGGALGIAFAIVGIRGLVRLAPHELPRITETSIDFQVLLFALAASVVTGLLCGLLSAFSASRINFLSQLQAGGVRGVTTSLRTRNALIACEVALSLMLVTGAGLLIRSYIRLLAEGPGFAGDVLSTRIYLPDGYAADRQTALFKRILQELNSRPEVIAAGANTNLPLGGSGTVSTLEIEGRSGKDKLSVHTRGVSPRYFETMGIPVLAGRVFEDRDYRSKIVKVVASEGFVNEFLAGQNAVGKRIRSGPGESWEEIVGVVRNVKNYELEEEPLGEIFRIIDQTPQSSIFLAIRGRIPPMKLAPMVRQIILAQDSGTAIDEFRTMQDRAWDAGAARRFHTSLLSGFASMALVLAVVGLFGLVGQSVRMRTPEIGLRVALGATRGRIFGMILGQGGRLMAVGTLGGLAGSWALSRFLSSWLYGVGTTDPITFIGAPLVLVVTGLAACCIPGMRASRIDPAIALRHE